MSQKLIQPHSPKSPVIIRRSSKRIAGHENDEEETFILPNIKQMEKQDNDVVKKVKDVIKFIKQSVSFNGKLDDPELQFLLTCFNAGICAIFVQSVIMDTKALKESKEIEQKQRNAMKRLSQYPLKSYHISKEGQIIMISGQFDSRTPSIEYLEDQLSKKPKKLQHPSEIVQITESGETANIRFHQKTKILETSKLFPVKSSPIEFITGAVLTGLCQLPALKAKLSLKAENLNLVNVKLYFVGIKMSTNGKEVLELNNVFKSDNIGGRIQKNASITAAIVIGGAIAGYFAVRVIQNLLQLKKQVLDTEKK